MSLRYDYLNMLRSRVGSEGVPVEDLQTLSDRLEHARASLKDRRDDRSIGFFDVPKIKPSLKEMRHILAGLPKEVDTLVVIGIGGSLLGAQALYAALGGLKKPGRFSTPHLKLIFAGDATDPQAVTELLDGVDWSRAAINIISKSGDTIEPMSVFTMAQGRMARAIGRGKTAKRIIATTDVRKGTLHAIADREGYATLPVPDNIGGRFSVLTEVGMFPALAAGIDVAGLWKGAAEATEKFWKETAVKNPATAFAGLQYLSYLKGKRVSVLMPYVQRLQTIGGWYRQLWAESLGKKMDRTKSSAYIGPTPVSAVGPADQHSQIQLYNEGPNDKTVTFVEIDEFAKDARLPSPWPDLEGTAYFSGHTFTEIVHYERQATAEALTMNRRPNGTIHLPDLSAPSVGGLLQTMMCATAIAGELFNVNAFDQPGVEAGKKAMYRLMHREGY